MYHETTSTAHPSRAKILLAFAAVYLIWGSTYLAIRYAVETIPPFFMAGCRFLIAGGTLYLLTRAGAATPFSRRDWAGAALLGALLLLCFCEPGGGGFPRLGGRRRGLDPP